MKPGTAPMTSDLSPVDRLKEIKDRSEAATIGEWCADPVEDSADWFVHSAQGPAFGIVAGQVTHEADAEFIAHSPADVGWLLEHIEQLQRQRQGLLDICAAAEAAELKPGVKDSLRIEVPWTRVVRMALGVDRD